MQNFLLFILNCISYTLFLWTSRRPTCIWRQHCVVSQIVIQIAVVRIVRTDIRLGGWAQAWKVADIECGESINVQGSGRWQIPFS